MTSACPGESIIGATSTTLDELRIARLGDADDNGKLIAEFGDAGARLRAIGVKISKETNLINEDMSRALVWEAVLMVG